MKNPGKARKESPARPRALMDKARTFCSRLWEEIYIDRDGNVYSCCCSKPRIAGNIYRQELEKICNNRTMRGLRQKALDGELPCLKDCFLRLQRRDEKAVSKLGAGIDYAGLKRLKISFGEACNINCIMCWQNSRDRRSLDTDKLIKNLDITPFGSIEIMGGEPLFIDAAKKFFGYAASRGKKVSFLTNGLLIDDEWAGKIAAHSAFVYFSLNAATKRTHELVNKGSRWELVLGNIKKVIAARKALRTGVRIIGHMTIVTANLAEIPVFIGTFGKLGFDEIEFGYDESALKHLAARPAERKALRLKIERALRRSADPSRINTHDLEHFWGLF